MEDLSEAGGFFQAASRCKKGRSGGKFALANDLLRRQILS